MEDKELTLTYMKDVEVKAIIERKYYVIALL